MQHFLSYLETRLETIYSKNEVKSIAKMLLKEQAGMSSAQIYSDKDTKFPNQIATKLKESVDRLEAGEPIQYILGETDFFDLRFKVAPGVLIPRPETEELVELILKDYQNTTTALNILDIGTGSGCIAVSLAKKRPQAQVSAWDISEEALRIAAENASLQQVDIDFYQQDIRSPKLFEDMEPVWDVIVSNPPYVCEREKTDMEKHVLDHEPHLALFVKDDDPLLFYRLISAYAAKKLKAGGRLYFEINSQLGQETLNLIREFNFQEVSLFQDLSGRDRMIRAIL